MSDTDQNVSPNTSLGARSGGVLRIVLVYAAFAGLWILLSDKVVFWLFSDPAQLTLASTLKGWLFVGVTSLLLYGLLRRRPAHGAPIDLSATRLPHLSYLLPMIVLVTAIVGLTVAGIVGTYSQQKGKEVARLQAIADLKARQIVDWLGERQADAEFVSTSHDLAVNYRHWREPGDATSQYLLFTRLEQLQQSHGSSAILLLDDRGARVWGSASASPAIAPVLRDAARQASLDLQVHRVGPYRGMAGRLRLDFVAPLKAAGAHAPIVVLQNDPTDWLFKTLQTWPVPSASGETLVYRRDGDRVLYLNELRHRADTALRLRMPVATPTLLSAQALRGEVRPGAAIEGTDYRGVPAVGVVRAIPGTDWFLIAKLDRAELYAEARTNAVWIGLSGLLALFVTLTGLYLLRQRQQLDLAAYTREAQLERLRALRLLAAIAESSSDAIYAKDLEGRYLLFNPAATRATGKTQEEVLGQDDTRLFPPEQAARIMAIDRGVMRDDLGDTYQEQVATAAGEASFHVTAGPLHDDQGKVIGLFGIARDITELKRAEAALLASEQTYRSLFDNMLNGFAYCRMLYEDGQPHDFVYLSVNRAFKALTGLKDVVGRKVSEVIPGIREADPELIERYGRVARSGQPERFEVFVVALRMWFSIAVYCPQPEHFVVVFDVITERKQAELALRESEDRFRTLFETAAVAIMIHDRDTGAIIEANRRAIASYGYDTLEELQQNEFWLEPPYSLEDAVTLINKAANQGPQRFEWMNRDQQGRIFWEDVLLNRVTLNGIERVLSITTDITVAKAAEAALIRQTDELWNRNEELERFNRATVGRELDMIELKKQINALYHQLGQEPPYPLAFLDGLSAQPEAGGAA